MNRSPIDPETFTLSVVVPCYNEVATIETALRRVRRAWPPHKEIIIVDDGSTDGTRALLEGPLAELVDKVIFHAANGGKGAALRTGFAAASGDIVIVQDADLEYDPNDWQRMFRPFLDGNADVVYGTRFATGTDMRRVVFFWHRLANGVLTFVSNCVTDLLLTDAHTCYKAFRREAIQPITIEEDRFAVCPELTVKLARAGMVFYEVPISYVRRNHAQGKKIGLTDAFAVVRALIKYGLLRRRGA